MPLQDALLDSLSDAGIPLPSRAVMSMMPRSLFLAVRWVLADISCGIVMVLEPQWLPAYRWLLSSEITCRESVAVSARTAATKSSSRVLVVAVFADGPVTLMLTPGTACLMAAWY